MDVNTAIVGWLVAIRSCYCIWHGALAANREIGVVIWLQWMAGDIGIVLSYLVWASLTFDYCIVESCARYGYLDKFIPRNSRCLGILVFWVFYVYHVQN